MRDYCKLRKVTCNIREIIIILSSLLVRSELVLLALQLKQMEITGERPQGQQQV